VATTVEQQRWLTPGVGSVGAASFFSDAGHEIATAVLPSFLTGVLHGSAAALGLIEGFADALTGAAKLLGGPLANDPARRRRLATGGYLGTALATGLIGAATTVWQVGVLRALAWTSRGIRSPSRDALLASVAPTHAYGRAYGLERAGDNLGAVIGPLLAAGLVAWIGIRHALYVAFLPGILAAVAIGVAAREARARHSVHRERPRFAWRALHEAGVIRALLPIALFEFGNVATTLLSLRATHVLTGHGETATAAASLAILIYAAHNAFGSVVALAAGRWVDHAGPASAFAAGGALYVLAYVGFAVGAATWWWLLAAFILAGAGIGLAETAQSALFAALLPDRLRGSGFGVLGGVQALGDLVATAVVGILYATVSPAVAFGYAATWMAASVVATGLLNRRRQASR
jgi:MFS family permease